MSDINDQAGSDGDGKNVSDLGWRAALPDDLKNHELIKNFTKPGDAIRDYVTVKQEAGKMLKIPNEQASEEEKNAFYAKLGRPESPEKYDLKRPDDIPEEMYNEGLSQEFSKFMYQKGVSKQVARDVFGWYHKMVADSDRAVKQQEKAAYDEAIGNLKKEWAGDAFAKNTNIATSAWNKFGKDESFNKFIQETKVGGIKLGDHPVFLKLFHAIGLATMDDNVSMRTYPGSDQGMDEREAQARKQYPEMYAKTG